MKKESKAFALVEEIQEVNRGRITDFKDESVKEIKRMLTELACNRVAAHCSNENMALDEKRDMDSVIDTLRNKSFSEGKGPYDVEDVDIDVLQVTCNWLEELRYWNLSKHELMKGEKAGLRQLCDAIQEEDPARGWDLQYISSSIYELILREKTEKSFVQKQDGWQPSLDALILSFREKARRKGQNVQVKKAILKSVVLYLQSLRELRYEEAKHGIPELLRTVVPAKIQG